MNKLKIGITCCPVAGGSGVVATELGVKLAERGHQVHFIAYALPFRLDVFKPNLFFHEVDTTSYQLFKYPPYTLTLSARMAEIACEYHLDVMHVHYAIPHATAAFLARQLMGERCSPVVVTTLHGTDITLVGADQSYYEITCFSIGSSDGLTAVSHYLADETRREFGIQKHIEVIHNFIDTTRFKPDAKCCDRECLASPDEKIICHISNFRPVKRAMDVIKIFRSIQQRVPSRLILIGEGPDTMLVRRAAKKNGLEDEVTFMGSQTKVEQILPMADLFLLPSEEESFGLAALEALACGVPVIGSSGTGLAEVIDHGVDGFLFPVGDTWSMANAGISLLTGEYDMAKFRENAAQKAREKFDADKIVDHYERFYYRVIGEKREARPARDRRPSR